MLGALPLAGSSRPQGAPQQHLASLLRRAVLHKHAQAGSQGKPQGLLVTCSRMDSHQTHVKCKRKQMNMAMKWIHICLRVLHNGCLHLC